MGPAIVAQGIVKTFGETRALDGIDLVIEEGTIYGLLGPNGAGKTTAVRVMATLLRPDSGACQVLGHDVVHEGKAVRRLISLTGQFASVDDELTGRENLILVGRLHGLGTKRAKARADQLLGAFGLDDAARRLVGTYSGGMRRRLDIAASLVVTPRILFLDEPTTGLDPRSRNQVWDIIRAIAATGTTVLLTTQYLEEADRLCDRMAVIDRGRVIAEGTSHELKARVGGKHVRVRLVHREDVERARGLLGERFGEVKPGNDPAELVASADASLVEAAMSELRDTGIEVAEYGVGAPSLDDVFFVLTGHGPRSDEDVQEVTA